MYKEKYIKYKIKYLDIKSQLGGVCWPSTPIKVEKEEEKKREKHDVFTKDKTKEIRTFEDFRSLQEFKLLENTSKETNEDKNISIIMELIQIQRESNSDIDILSKFYIDHIKKILKIIEIFLLNDKKINVTINLTEIAIQWDRLIITKKNNRFHEYFKYCMYLYISTFFYKEITDLEKKYNKLIFINEPDKSSDIYLHVTNDIFVLIDNLENLSRASSFTPFNFYIILSPSEHYLCNPLTYILTEKENNKINKYLELFMENMKKFIEVSKIDVFKKDDSEFEQTPKTVNYNLDCIPKELHILETKKDKYNSSLYNSLLYGLIRLNKTQKMGIRFVDNPDVKVPQYYMYMRSEIKKWIIDNVNEQSNKNDGSSKTFLQLIVDKFMLNFTTNQFFAINHSTFDTLNLKEQEKYILDEYFGLMCSGYEIIIKAFSVMTQINVVVFKKVNKFYNITGDYCSDGIWLYHDDDIDQFDLIFPPFDRNKFAIDPRINYLKKVDLNIPIDNINVMKYSSYNEIIKKI
jgi:hypothetical protein